MKTGKASDNDLIAVEILTMDFMPVNIIKALIEQIEIKGIENII